MAEPSLRVLALHAFYQVLGGEDVSHRAETAMLRERGHEVLDITVDNADLAQLGTVARLRATVSNPETARRVEAAIAEFRPEVAYANNLFPGLSSSVIRVCRDSGIPVVRVLRNYRFTCVSGNLFRNGHACEACLGGGGASAGGRAGAGGPAGAGGRAGTGGRASLGLPGVIHGCYRGSRATSAVATVARHVDRSVNEDTWWIAVSQFVRERAIRAGLPADRIWVRPNLALPAMSGSAAGASGSVDATEPSHLTGASDTTDGDSAADPSTILYVGRDSIEKGLPLLLDAFALLRRDRPDARLWIAGAHRDAAPAGVTWLGHVAPDTVPALMARADVLAVPSVWPEPFGRVVIEALAAGTPVVAAASGGLAELDGPAVRTFSPAEPRPLAAALDAVLDEPRAWGRAMALERFDADFSPHVWYHRTMDVFARAMG